MLSNNLLRNPLARISNGKTQSALHRHLWRRNISFLKCWNLYFERWTNRGGTAESPCENVAVIETKDKPKPISVRQIRRDKKAGFAKQYKVITKLQGLELRYHSVVSKFKLKQKFCFNYENNILKHLTSKSMLEVKWTNNSGQIIFGCSCARLAIMTNWCLCQRHSTLASPSNQCWPTGNWWQ